MATIIADDLAVCSDCAMLIANGECGNYDDDGNDIAPAIAAAQVAIWGADAIGLTLSACGECTAVYGEDAECDPWFSWRQCDGCGSTLGGDRLGAVVIR